MREVSLFSMDETLKRHDLQRLQTYADKKALALVKKPPPNLVGMALLCTRVLITSNGVVIAAAVVPAIAPATKYL